MFVVNCYEKGQIQKGIEEALSILQFAKIPREEVSLTQPKNQIISD